MELYLPSDELRAIEAFAEAGGMSSLQMIKQAATVCYDYIKAHYTPCKILILCGRGNNGADGLMLASLLSKSYTVTVYQPTLGAPESPCAVYRKKASEEDIVFTMTPNPSDYDLIVDAVYGIGFRLPLSEDMKNLFCMVNTSDIPVIALDIPSGVEADTGKCDISAIRADITLTFTRKKPGLMVYPGAEHAGQVVLLDAGIPIPEGITSAYTSLTDLSLYPKRRDNSHKGTYGTLCILAGSVGMAGAAYLAALAAYRTGIGLVKIVTPNENRIILQTMLPEAVLVCYDGEHPDLRAIEKSVHGCDALVAGPGIGTSEVSAQILAMLLSVFDGCKTVLDADALNLMASNGNELPKGAVITPHPKEFSRLSGLSVKDITASPLNCAMAFAENHKVITLLKGARSVIADPKGDVRINLSGNHGMATAGSGDVLSGIVGALLTLGLSSFDAASLGAYIHGKAGDIAAEKIGKPSLVASDIANSIADVLKKV